MHIFFEIVAVYLVYAFSLSALIWRYATKDRIPNIVVACAAPMIFIASLIRFIVSAISGKTRVVPCPPGLHEAENIVEDERVRLFGGMKQQPTFAANWTRAYAFSIERDAQRVQDIARQVFIHA